MSGILDSLKTRLPEHLRPTKEPLAYLAAVLAAAFVVYRMLVGGESFTDVLGEHYVEGIIGVLVTGLARASVYAPRTVKAADSAFLDVHLGDMVADDEQG